MSRLRLGSDYIPLVNEDSPSRFRVIFSFSKVAWFTVALPFFGFIFCVIWSMMYNFEKATETHCKVYNFLPSVSAAIGHYKPQKNIWETVIGIQAITRALVFYMYYKHYKETTYKWAKNITYAALIFYFIENISLVVLSFCSSNDNYVIHKIAFISFLLSSLLHMFLSWVIASNCKKTSKDTNDNVSLRWKFNSMISNVISIVLASYFFYRHNKYCEPLVYSMFALTEYIVVITNMSFHASAAYDFAGTKLLLSTNGFKII